MPPVSGPKPAAAAALTASFKALRLVNGDISSSFFLPKIVVCALERFHLW
jgi:hypothetical protein